MIPRFTKENFRQYCDRAGKADPDLQAILRQWGYPPVWVRPANFTTLLHIILEQQVSLASARAALTQLRRKIGPITPQKVLQLTDREMRSCYFSRQKMGYARNLATAVVSGTLDLKGLKDQDDELVRTALKNIKGIGDWTADIYLLMALQRMDIFPVGDLAMVNSLKQIKQFSQLPSWENILQLADAWRPHRSMATMILWHHYLIGKSK